MNYTVLKIGDTPAVWYEDGSIEIKEIGLVKKLTRADWDRVERVGKGENPSWKKRFFKAHPGVENLRTIQFAEKNWPCDLKVELQDGYRIVTFPLYAGNLIVLDKFTPGHKDYDTVFFETVELIYNKKKVFAVIENGETTRIRGGMPKDRALLNAFTKEKLGIFSTLHYIFKKDVYNTASREPIPAEHGHGAGCQKERKDRT